MAAPSITISNQILKELICLKTKNIFENPKMITYNKESNLGC